MISPSPKVQHSRRLFLASIAALAGCAHPSTHSSSQSKSAAPIGSATASTGSRWSTPANVLPLKIGVCLPLTGVDYEFGLAAKQGIELAIDECKKQSSKKNTIEYELVFADSASSGEELSAKVSHLIKHERVSVILGEVSSAQTMVIRQQTEPQGIVLLTPSATHPDVTSSSSLVFRSCFSDTLQAKSVANYMVNQLKKKKMGLLYTPHYPYSVALADEFRRESTRLSAAPAIEFAIEKSNNNFQNMFTQIKAANIDALYAPVFYNSMIMIAQLAQKEGLPGSLFVGSDGWDSPDLLRYAGSTLEGALFTNHWTINSPTSHNRAFITDFSGRFSAPPTPLAAIGFDSMMLLHLVLQLSLNHTPASIADSFRKIRNFTGVTGEIASFEGGDPHKSIELVQIRQSSFQYYATIKPPSLRNVSLLLANYCDLE